MLLHRLVMRRAHRQCTGKVYTRRNSVTVTVGAYRNRTCSATRVTSALTTLQFSTNDNVIFALMVIIYRNRRRDDGGTLEILCVKLRAQIRGWKEREREAARWKRDEWWMNGGLRSEVYRVWLLQASFYNTPTILVCEICALTMEAWMKNE